MTETGKVVFAAIDRVIYGERAGIAVAEEAERLGSERVFLVASASLDAQTDEIEQVRAALGPRFAGKYTGMPSHTPRPAVVEAAAAARDAGADLVVSVGGGSVTDATKVLLVCLKHDITEPDGLEPFHVRVVKDGTVVKPAFEGPDIRSIAVPTTLSGGEFNPLGGSTDLRKKLKEGYEHPLLVPRSVIFDPALTVHTPEWLWMSTGVRALDHALETLGSLQSNIYCDSMAESAIRLLAEGLPRVKADPSDLDARLKCQVGVWQSMTPVVAGVQMGLSHAIGHVLGGTCGVPHGHTSCVMAPFVLAFNEPVNGERQKRISAAFGEPDRPASEIVDEFIAGLGMPRSLSAVGVADDQLPLVAKYTMHDFWARTNPRPIEKAEDVMQVLEMAR